MSEQPKREPGPWTHTEGRARQLMFKRPYWQVGRADGDRRGVALVFGDDDSNARLIASAPELLAAACAAEAYISGARAELAIDRREALDTVLPALRAAIAKAEGRS